MNYEEWFESHIYSNLALIKYGATVRDLDVISNK